MPLCKHRMMGARQLPIEDGGLELDNSKLTICALELDNSTFSALELEHSTLSAHLVMELHHSR